MLALFERLEFGREVADEVLHPRENGVPLGDTPNCQRTLSSYRSQSESLNGGLARTLRSLSAASHSLAAKPMLAVLPLALPSPLAAELFLAMLSL